MTGLSRATANTHTGVVDATALKAFRDEMQGAVLDEQSPAYEEARTIWNAMIDRRPALIAQCATAADVAKAVRFARDNRLLVAVRGGGHNIAGNAVCDDGLMIDLSPMKSVRVDAASKRAWVEPGATLADVDRETQAFGLALPTGINSTTGIAGLTLGGGFGWITRKYGLTIDNLLVSRCRDRRRRAGARERDGKPRPLLGAARRRRQFRRGHCLRISAFHVLRPRCSRGWSCIRFADAEAVLKQYRQVLETAPDELTCWTVMRKAPPLPFLPVEWHGKEVLVLAMCYCGDIAGRRAGDGRLARDRQRRLPSSSVPIHLWVGSRHSIRC